MRMTTKASCLTPCALLKNRAVYECDIAPQKGEASAHFAQCLLAWRLGAIRAGGARPNHKAEEAHAQRYF